jgi:hypothetical protein
VSDIVLRQSGFVHLLDLGPTRVLAMHAVTQMRLTVTPSVAHLIRFFAEPHAFEAALPHLEAALDADATTIGACATALLDRGILTTRTHAEETVDAINALADAHGRDPADLLDQYRRKQMEGAHPYWSVEAPHALEEANHLHRRIDILRRRTPARRHRYWRPSGPPRHRHG